MKITRSQPIQQQRMLTYCSSNCPHNLKRQTQSSVEVPTVFITPVISEWREKLV